MRRSIVHLNNAAAATARSRRAFDRQANVYDNAHWGDHARGLYDDVLAHLDALDFGSILDVGCGTGALLRAFVVARPEVVALGLDLSPGMVEVARRRLGDLAHLTLGDATRLPYETSSVDIIICVDSFHHYPDPRAVLLEMQRVLRPTSHLILADFWLPRPARQIFNAVLRFLPYGDVRVYSERQLLELARTADFAGLTWAPAGRRGQLLVGGPSAGR